MAWRLANSLDTLRDELNARWAGRDKSSDGGIGDAAHAAQGSASDHNPWIIDDVGRGVVRAYDIDVDLDGSNDGNGGQALEDLREHLRQLGAAGDPRLQDHGYVISNGQIASEKSNWQWVPHTKDPHFDHIHVSVARNQAGYDDTSSWLTTIQGDDNMSAETEGFIKDIHEWMNGEKDHPAVKAEFGITTSAGIVGAIQDTLKLVLPIGPDGKLDLSGLAAKISAKLPAGTVDAAVLEDAVKQALREGTG